MGAWPSRVTPSLAARTLRSRGHGTAVTRSPARGSGCHPGRQAPRRAHALPARRSHGPGPVRGRYWIAAAPNAQSRSRHMALLAGWYSGSRSAVICAYVSTTPPSHRNLASAAGSIHLPMMPSRHPPTVPIFYPRHGPAAPPDLEKPRLGPYTCPQAPPTLKGGTHA